MFPKNRNIAFKINSEEDFNYINNTLMTPQNFCYKNFGLYGNKITYIYFNEGLKYSGYDETIIESPIKNYPEENYILINVETILLKEKLKRIKDVTKG